MHYYKRNIGDYAKKAGRLSILQHGVYNLLIDACYDREQFPTRDEAIDWTWASSAAEIEAVDFVLRKFFTLENGVYVQNRIREEIEEYHAKAAINARIANERETKRKEKNTNRARSVHDTSPVEHEAPPNHKPITTNHNKEEEGSAGAREPDPPPLDLTPPPPDGKPKGKGKTKSKAVLSPLTFDADKMLILGISDALMARWIKVCPHVDVALEIDKATLWLVNNPDGAEQYKDTIGRFVNGWLLRHEKDEKEKLEQRRLVVAQGGNRKKSYGETRDEKRQRTLEELTSEGSDAIEVDARILEPYTIEAEPVHAEPAEPDLFWANPPAHWPD